MAVVSLRALANHPNLPIGVYNNPVNYQFYAEDWQLLRDAVQFGKYGISTYSLATVDTLSIGSTAAITGNTTVGGTLGVTGAFTGTSTGSFGSNLTVTGNITVSGTVDGVDVSSHDHTGGAGGQIPTAGIADAAVTFVKIAAAAIGSSAGTLTSSTVTRGDVTADVKTTIANQTNGIIFESARNAFVISITATGTSAVLNPYGAGAEGCRFAGYGTTAGNPPMLEFFDTAANSGIAIFYFNLPAGLSSGTLTYKLHYVIPAISVGNTVDVKHGYKLIATGSKFGVTADDFTYPTDYSAVTTTQVGEPALDNEILTTASSTIATTGNALMMVAVQRLDASTSTNSLFLIGVSLHYTASYTL